MIWPLILWLCLIFNTRTVLLATALAISACLSMLIAILPWTLWTYHSTGKPMLSTSGAGGAMYQSLGEIPNNPWGIVLNDDQLVRDARAHGYATAWTPGADKHYNQLWLASISAEPGFYAKTVLTQRLPLALMPPYSYRRGKETNFNIAVIQRTEGLTKLGVLIKYPLDVLRHRAVDLLMGGISLFLLVMTFVAMWLERRNWPSIIWLISPLVVTVVSMSLIKQIEARNMSVILVVQVIALALVVYHLRQSAPKHEIS